MIASTKGLSSRCRQAVCQQRLPVTGDNAPSQPIRNTAGASGAVPIAESPRANRRRAVRRTESAASQWSIPVFSAAPTIMLPWSPLCKAPAPALIRVSVDLVQPFPDNRKRFVDYVGGILWVANDAKCNGLHLLVDRSDESAMDIVGCAVAARLRFRPAAEPVRPARRSDGKGA